MRSSQNPSSRKEAVRSIGKVHQFSPTSQQNLPLTTENLGQPGSMNDSGMVRSILVDAMKQSGFSRAEIADRMSGLTATTITEKMLHNFSAESRSDVRWPAEWDRAFCAAVGDNRLLTCRAELAGLHFTDDTGLELMELGREFLLQKRAAARLMSLETRLQGVDLG